MIGRVDGRLLHGALFYGCVRAGGRLRTRAESLTNMVMDVTPDAILILDSTLHVQDISLTAKRMFNCHRAAVRGKPLSGKNIASGSV
ncbi:PAS domain-containing protein [Dehalococcoidia bacterium]|nr:PAS domain-containing protein [Dehalococcoidia bacterium]